MKIQLGENSLGSKYCGVAIRLYVINQLQKCKAINVGIAVISELLENYRELNVYSHYVNECKGR